MAILDTKISDDQLMAVMAEATTTVACRAVKGVFRIHTCMLPLGDLTLGIMVLVGKFMGMVIRTRFPGSLKRKEPSSLSPPISSIRQTVVSLRTAPLMGL